MCVDLCDTEEWVCWENLVCGKNLVACPPRRPQLSGCCEHGLGRCTAGHGCRLKPGVLAKLAVGHHQRLRAVTPHTLPLCLSSMHDRGTQYNL